MLPTEPVRFTDYSLILKHGFRLLAVWAQQNHVEVQTFPQDLEDLPEVIARTKGRDIKRRNIQYAVVMNVVESPETVEALVKFGKVVKGYPWPQ